MNKIEIKAALIEAGAKAKQNRKDYFKDQPHKYDFDYRDRGLRTRTRGLHIALAYLQGRPFGAVEKYNYKTYVPNEKLTYSVWAERYQDQLAALKAATEILGFTETVTMAGRTVTRPAFNEQFENWVQGIKAVIKRLDMYLPGKLAPDPVTGILTWRYYGDSLC